MSSRGTKYWSARAIPLIAPDILGDIIATASDISIVVTDMGHVLSVLVNPHHASFGHLDHWEGRDLRDFLTGESVTKLDAQLKSFSSGEEATRSVELNHTDGTTWEFPVRYSFHQVGPDGALLMLGRDLRPIAEMQQQLVEAQLALERDYEAQRDSDTRLRVLMESTDDAVAFVSLASGRVSELNATAASILGQAAGDLVGSAFSDLFQGDGQRDVIERLTDPDRADQRGPVEMTARKTGRPVAVTPRVFRAAGERMLFCRMAEIGPAGTGSDALTGGLLGLYDRGADAIVFTDLQGLVTTANEAFLNLADLSHAGAARGKPIADFLSRGSVDARVLIDNAVRAGRMRLYSTKLTSEFGGQTPVEISATHLSDAGAIAFVLRDAGRAEALRMPQIGGGDDSARSVMELVGSATLKEIVAETTDVVEKMCIETAVELTNNNRVAAAEMLGLSRQSLYVKLRKYGLLARHGD
ncbi:transcriptional regulator PpsR [Tranquillimonas rosea]|uniref:Transcriptional regulator PpsR n=1 Tax=Tranquillimonas rosea TaxID=641238 RepID=A0A1H9SKD0_9RHOB|nr:transcriptional regulator PpsR [Tranquillimonas rosea]SER85407.1 transcriptional regulator PpsR [Tranquillimonas rosea]